MIVSNTTEAGIYYENIPYPTACPTSYAKKVNRLSRTILQTFSG